MKIVILYSGGLDSLIMDRYAQVNYPDAEVIKLWYDIGQPYNYKEEAALPDDVIKLKLDWLTRDEELHGKSDSQSGNIIIAGRNLVLATMAACKFLPDELWMGALLGEMHAGSTDKNQAFLDHINNTFKSVLSPFYEGDKCCTVRFPLADAGFGKLEACQWAYSNGITRGRMRHSSSCLSGEKGNCGRCVVCLRRWGIFKQLGFSETYNKHPIEDAKETKAMIKEMICGDHYDDFRRREVLPALEDYYFRFLIEDDHETTESEKEKIIEYVKSRNSASSS